MEKKRALHEDEGAAGEAKTGQLHRDGNDSNDFPLVSTR